MLVASCGLELAQFGLKVWLRDLFYLESVCSKQVSHDILDETVNQSR